MASIPSFESALDRTLWVQHQLRAAGSSFAAIALRNEWSRGAVAKAMYAPSDPQERAIADQLGVRQQDLFPERFDPRGRRKHPVKNRASAPAGNVKESRAA
jgi:lambda repressor-like predicted transcriptional regulator